MDVRMSSSEIAEKLVIEESTVKTTSSGSS
jgi:DNA-binding NarL/FixJ family response regulator